MANPQKKKIFFKGNIIRKKNMLSLADGLPVAKIKGGPDDGVIIHLKKPQLRLSATHIIKADKNESSSVELEDNNCGIMRPIANSEHHEILYVCGPSGSGKSTYIGNYVKSYKQVFPKKRIVVISGVHKDKPLDDIEGIKRLDVTDETLIDNPLVVDDFRGENYGSLVIFDDFDSITDKKIREAVFDFLDRLLKTCRIHTDEKLSMKQRRNLDIDVMVTGHQIFNYKATREIINELTSITIFPQAGNSYQITQFLKRYMGLDLKNIDRIYEIGEISRWVTLYRQFPQWVLYEKGCYMLKRKIRKTRACKDDVEK
jgi:hypothetical protein